MMKLKRAFVFLLCLMSVSTFADMLPSQIPCPSPTPDAGPRVFSGTNLYLTADFIYWSVKQEGLEWSVKDSGVVENTNDSRQKYNAPDFTWEPGFKIGLGAHATHDGWDIYGQYTRIISPGISNKQTATLSENMTAFWGNNQLILSGQVRWDFYFNAVDLELGRNFYISPFLKLRPFIGLKGSWQDQDYIIEFENAPSVLDPGLTNIRIHQDQGGIGIRSGLNTAWQMHRLFSVFGDFALSGIWTYFDVRRDFLFIPTDPVFPIISFFLSKDQYVMKFVLEWAIGLRAEGWWKDDRYHGMLQVGWEQQSWVTNNQYILTDSPQVGGGDLSFQGLTIKARLDF